MPDTEYLRSLVAETTELMREIILDQGKQVQDLKTSVTDIKDLTRRIDKIEDRYELMERRVEDLCKQQAVDEYSRGVISRDEGRAYEERKSNLEKVINIATQVAGVVALVAVILSQIGG